MKLSTKLGWHRLLQLITSLSLVSELGVDTCINASWGEVVKARYLFKEVKYYLLRSVG